LTSGGVNRKQRTESGGQDRVHSGIVRTVALIVAQGCVGGAADVESDPGPSSSAPPALACAAEALEPSSSAEQPRLLRVGETLTGRACLNEPDVFLLDSAEREGELLRVSVKQLQGLGELDPRVSVSAAFVPGAREALGIELASQARAGTSQLDIGFVARGERHLLTVNVITDLAPEFAPGRAYAVSLERLVRSDGDCCSSDEGPGCADDTLLTCLCPLDNACCREAYDATCVAEARASCGLVCGGGQPKADCCTASGVGGCSAPSLEDCVCAVDPYCCVGGFDEHCVNLAVGRCGAACPDLDQGAP